MKKRTDIIYFILLLLISLFLSCPPISIRVVNEAYFDIIKFGPIIWTIFAIFYIFYFRPPIYIIVILIILLYPAWFHFLRHIVLGIVLYPEQ